jgi:NADH:ubiquinone oxidoreductase subunit K
LLEWSSFTHSNGEATMLKTILITIAAVASAVGLALVQPVLAHAAAAPMLDGVSLATAGPSAAQSKCA